MKTTILKITAILALLATSVSSCKDKEGEGEESDIAGVWVKETVYSDETGDTIVFTNDNRVEKYFQGYEGWEITYGTKPDSLSIRIIHPDEDVSVSKSFKYSIQKDNLVISAFTYPFSLVQVARKEVVFKRVEYK